MKLTQCNLPFESQCKIPVSISHRFPMLVRVATIHQAPPNEFLHYVTIKNVAETDGP